MEQLNNKVDGAGGAQGSLPATEWNQVPSELQNIITQLGLSLSAGDLNQLGKAIAGYVANGDFYTDGGAANAYVLTVIGSKQRAPAYTDGFRVRFIPDNTNTGASTINVGALGVKSIVNSAGAALAGNEIVSGVMTELFFDLANDRFVYTGFVKLTGDTMTGDLLVQALVGSTDLGTNKGILLNAVGGTGLRPAIVLTDAAGAFIERILQHDQGNFTVFDLPVRTNSAQDTTSNALARVDYAEALKGLAGNYDVILAAGSYSSGSFSIPGGRNWGDYDQIIVVGNATATVLGVGGNVGIGTQELFAENTNAWTIRVSSDSTEYSEITAISATQFSVARAGNDTVKMVLGLRKQGVA